MKKLLYCKVVIPLLNIDYLDYVTDNQDAKIGQIVKVPFKSKYKIGVIFHINYVTEVPESKLKAISEFLESEQLNHKFIQFIINAANYYCESVSKFLKLAIPSEELFKIIKNKQSIKVPSDLKQAELSDEQNKVYESLRDAWKDDQYNVTLLQGVTGSGKTEVYLKLIEHILINSLSEKQILILVPEIALTNQLIKKIKDRLVVDPVMWHSETTISEKRKIYNGISTGEIRLVVGARSSLFLPYKNLGLIIVDEEHDGSYKQEEKIMYNARDMAIYRAFHEKFMVLLASATPSIETIQNVIDKKYNSAELPSRYGKQNLPTYRVIDMKMEKLKPNNWISDNLRMEIISVIKQNKQVLLYLNRRGYAPLLICTSCGFKLLCPNCSTWLVEHRQDNKLKCHHCGYSKVNQQKCSSCKTTGCLKACGPGVERIAEEVRSFLPDTNITIITKDTVTSASKVDELFNEIIANNVNVIIGTQMIAKGHHFPNLVLVGIIDADVGFGGVDLRATEKTYQLLEQVSGRSGREQPGRVSIQTYNTDSELLKFIIENNRKGFIEEEIRLRRHFKLPPFTKLVSILVTSKREEIARNFAYKVYNLSPKVTGIEIFEPTSSYLVRLNDKFRYRILLKFDKKFDYQKYLKIWLEAIHVPHYLNLKVDVDPYNFA